MPCFIVDLVTETRGINNGQGNSGSFVIQLEFLIPRLAPLACFRSRKKRPTHQL